MAWSSSPATVRLRCAGGEPPHELVLGRVCVLVLVDQDRPPAPPVAGGQVGRAEQCDAAGDQVVEVERVGALQLGVDLGPDGGDDLLDVVVQDESAELVRRGGREAVARDEVILGARDGGENWPNSNPVIRR